MALLNIIQTNSHFNFLSFGTLLALAFIIFLSVFLLTLKNKSESTFHLGFAFLCLSLFMFGYLTAAAVYHPFAAYHRYFTTFWVLPTITHIGLWGMYYPENNHPKMTKVIMIGGWGIAIAAEIFFILNTYSVPRKYHFTGHYWDFDAEPISKAFGILIMLYSVIGFLAIPVWKFIIVKTKERWTILQMGLGFLVAATVPNITNVLSRDGVIDREIYLLSLVSLFVLGFFFVVLIFINHTKDKTTFMVKIVGITLVTFFLMLQGLSYFVMKDNDNAYDALRLEYSDRVIEGGAKNKDIQYLLQLDKKGIVYKDYKENQNLDVASIKEDFLNTIVYEEINNLPEANFRSDLKKILSNTHETFEGYKAAINDFLENNPSLDNHSLKENIFPFFAKLNRSSFVHTNKISVLSSEHFCKEATKYLDQNKGLIHFRDAIYKHLKDCKWDEKELSSKELLHEIDKYFRYFKPAETRHYRKSLDSYDKQKHFVAFMTYDKNTKLISEIGFSYLTYRDYIHPAAKTQKIILGIVLVVVIFLYPLFFKGSLINPLQSLLRGVTKVNRGELDVVVPIKVQDEIGFLSGSFNSMVASIKDAQEKLQDYADNLEEKVEERTREVREKMEEIKALKIHQDGDYYLTSLLTKPLFFNANKSSKVKTNFVIKQKKTFEFRNKQADLGGDICVTGNLKFGTPDNFKRYTMAMNGDAMGKSMQGAGGSLVMGVVMNSIMARSAGNKRILDSTPEQWLTDIYHETNGVFKSFNGTMVLSCVVAIVDDESGEMWYFNAEHPFSVLYRDGRASFIEDRLNLRKLGLDSEIEFQVFKYQLHPGDVIILGSDGRDDINLTPDENTRTINEDENLFLKFVEEGKGDIPAIIELIKKAGEITDDLSFLKIDFQGNGNEEIAEPTTQTISNEVASSEDSVVIDIDGSYPEEEEDVESYYQEAKKFLKENNPEQALKELEAGYSKSHNNPKLNKLLALLSFKGKNYDTAIEVLGKYLEYDPDVADFWFYLSIAHKRLGKYESSLEAAEKLKNIQPQNIQNLINLADLNRILGRIEDALAYQRKAIDLDPNNRSAKKLAEILQKNQTSGTIEEE
ncbi:MAG: SpoIIE family protein phosphatase [Leptospiraceae bacterium]|nr:SpoIIE family protein phosphatase [Leptospiraceae bacterium]NUM41951.1 SpoIIE family protein phosphatase [Leptospiraceae bacterium]